MPLRKKLYHAIGRKTPEEKIRDRVKVIKQLVQEKTQKNQAQNEIEGVKKEFYLDGLMITDKNGKILKSNGGEKEFKETIKKTGIHKYIDEELPETEIFTFRSNGQNYIIYNEEDKMYFMKTPGSISTVEIRRIAQKVNGDQHV